MLWLWLLVLIIPTADQIFGTFYCTVKAKHAMRTRSLPLA